jgi:1,4-dihydroxy-2-naphthoyl-CoA hydrolase
VGGSNSLNNNIDNALYWRKVILFEGAKVKIEGNIEFTVIEQKPEQVISEMPIQSGILNPFGVVHAGAILWFADVTATILAMGSTQFSENMSGFPLGINLNANFAGNQKTGKFKAVATFVKKGKTVSVVRTIVYGENDKLIADVSTNHVASR